MEIRIRSDGGGRLLPLSLAILAKTYLPIHKELV